MDYTEIISAVIALISALVSAFLIPWIKERVGADNLKLQEWLNDYIFPREAHLDDRAVKAAEQLYNANEGAEKKAYVLQYLAERGIKFDSDTVDKMIESAVLTLHHELYGGSNGTEN